MLELPDKGFLIGGLTSTDSNYYRISLLRTDSFGRQIWQKDYEGIPGKFGNTVVDILDYVVSMVLTPEGNVAVCSKTASGSAVHLFKINLNGSLVWSRIYSGLGGAMSVINDPAGGLVVTGITYNANGYKNIGHLWLMKTDTTGTVVWSKEYLDSTFYQLWGCQVIPSRGGGFLVCGNVGERINTWGTTSFLMLKVDKTGKLLWSNFYYANEAYNSMAKSVVELPDKSIYMAGYSGESVSLHVYATIHPKLTLVKLDSTGSLQWANTYSNNYPGGESFASIIYDNTKKVLDAGVIFHSSVGFALSYMRINPAGKVIFIKSYVRDSMTYISGTNLVHLSSGGVAIAVLRYPGIYITGGWPPPPVILTRTDSGGKTNGCVDKPHTLTQASLDLTTTKIDLTTRNFSMKTGNQNSISTLKFRGDVLICPPFVPYFGWLNPCSGDKVSFYDSSYYKPTNWLWDFGDPASSTNTCTLQNPKHIYKKAGNYIVKLIAGNGSVKDSVFRKITILQSPLPFKSDTLICSGTTIKLKVTGAPKYIWRPGKLVSDSISPTPSIKPKKTTTLVVLAFGTNGCISYDTAHITVDNKPNPPKNSIRYCKIE